MSTDKEFTNPVVLGSTDKNNFSMTVADFNQAIIDTGVTTFRDIAIYMRVDAGGSLSNDILFFSYYISCKLTNYYRSCRWRCICFIYCK